MHWAYVAGYFDGEGTVNFYQAKVSRFVTRALIWHNSDVPSLLAIQSFIGCGQIRAREIRGHQRRPVHTLTVCNKADLVRVIDGMRPYLIIKREAADRLYDFLVNHVDETRRNNYGKMAAVSTEQLRTWYVDEQLSLYAIARKVGVGTAAAGQALTVRGIPRRHEGWHAPKSEATIARLRATKRKQWADPVYRAQQLERLAAARRAKGFTY